MVIKNLMQFASDMTLYCNTLLVLFAQIKQKISKLKSDKIIYPWPAF